MKVIAAQSFFDSLKHALYLLSYIYVLGMIINASNYNKEKE